MSEFKQAERVMTGWSARLEKRVLVWLARRMPAVVNSDHLTALGFAGMVGAAASFVAARWYQPALFFVPFFLAVNWFGDSLDGTVARVRNQQRPRYGFYVDHMLDAIGTAILLGGLAVSGYMTPTIAASLLVLYFLLSIEVYLATYCLGSFRLAFLRVGPTELRIILATGAVVLYYNPTVSIIGRELLLFDIGGTVAMACILPTVLVSAVRNGLTLYRLEPVGQASETTSP